MNLHGLDADAEFEGNDLVGLSGHDRPSRSHSRAVRCQTRLHRLSLRVLPALAGIGLQSTLDPFEEQIIVERLFDEVERTGLAAKNHHP